MGGAYDRQGGGMVIHVTPPRSPDRLCIPKGKGPLLADTSGLPHRLEEMTEVATGPPGSLVTHVTLWSGIIYVFFLRDGQTA